MTELTNKPQSTLLSRRTALTAGSTMVLAGAAGLLSAPAASAASPSDYPKLKVGMVHREVGMLASYLRTLGLLAGQQYNDRFSLTMQSSVMKHQSRYGLTTDGVVGPKTWTSMIVVAPSSRWGYPTLRRGSRTNQVLAVQRSLVARQRRSLADDMVFGAATESRVREYQRSCGLVADGVVGSRTWAALRTGR